MMWPPQRVKMHSTPAALSARPARIPPCTSAMGITSSPGKERAIDGITAPTRRSNEEGCARGAALHRIESRRRPTLLREVGPAVVLPRRLVVTLHRGALFAEAHGAQVVRRHAEVDEVSLHRIGA